MMTFTKPTEQKIQSLINNKWVNSSFNYLEVGDTKKEKMPDGYNHDIKRIKLGEGAEIFLRGKEAIVKWKTYGMNWIGVHSETLPLEENQISVTFLKMGLWATNPCRIIYVVDEQDKDFTRFGFAFGTIADHPETGEELFLIEWNHKDNSVFYEIKVFSRPRHLLAAMVYPLTRYLQKRFFHDSLQAVYHYVNS